VDDLALELEQRLDKCNVEIIAEEVHVLLLFLAFLRVKFLRVLNLNN